MSGADFILGASLRAEELEWRRLADTEIWSDGDAKELERYEGLNGLPASARPGVRYENVRVERLVFGEITQHVARQ